MLKILSRIPDQDIYKTTKSPPEQYSKSKVKIEEIGEKIKPLNEYENAIMFLHDVLVSSNSRLVDQFFVKSRHNNLDIQYLSQFHFDFPKRTIRDNGNKKLLFNQTLKDVEIIYREVAGYDMSMKKLKKYAENHGKRIINIFVLIGLKREVKGGIVIVMRARKSI